MKKQNKLKNLSVAARIAAAHSCMRDCDNDGFSVVEAHSFMRDLDKIWLNQPGAGTFLSVLEKHTNKALRNRRKDVVTS